MLEVGMKAMIVGARTALGQQFIGRIVTIHQVLQAGDFIDKETLRDKIDVLVPAGANSDGGAVVQGEIHPGNPLMLDGFAIFQGKHLMPLPPLADPGIDESTFTPIKNHEPVGA